MQPEFDLLIIVVDAEYSLGFSVTVQLFKFFGIFLRSESGAHPIHVMEEKLPVKVFSLKKKKKKKLQRTRRGSLSVASVAFLCCARYDDTNAECQEKRVESRTMAQP